MSSCTTCNKSASEVPLKRCAKCQITEYCSRDCQKQDWKTHKKTCGKPDQPGAGGRQFASSTPSSQSSSHPPRDANPFIQLNQGSWLHGRPEKEVYGLLIDTFRLRADDQYKFEGDAEGDGVYGGASDSIKPFRRFLKKVESKPGLLPAWWNPEKTKACIQLGSSASGWSSLRSAVGKSDIIEHYGDSFLPMQMRMFGESMYGNTPGATSGAGGMMQQLMMAASGGGMMANHLDLSGDSDS
ncbi:hypothetical protein QBC36DRAFT_339990 [Triangularia setosa]|uniref:MYND-type domain-containing protein n=1 Tax=Triangularia setosa TaxID=2587417 RepID=A0AAN7A2X8_9PEZI|nr:hypothetical protein QBC36DRAFT_339990 [Podospora setosa]